MASWRRSVCGVLLVALAPLSAWAQSLPPAAPSSSAQSSPGPASSRAERLLRTGRAYLAAGDRGSAIGFFREAVQADPTTPAAYLALGEAYRARGSFGDARAVFEAGLARSPDSGELWLGLARTLTDAGSPEDAASAVRSLLARLPDHAEGLRMRAELAQRRGAWSEALTATRALAALGGSDAEGLRREEAALRLLARPLDPVSAARACEGSSLRARLARCE